MMSSHRSIARKLLLAIAAMAPLTAPCVTPIARAADDPYPALVRQLGDRDPAVRKSAYDALAQAVDAARPALRDAAHSGRPAVAAAATDLLLHAKWFTADDPVAVQTRLAFYGTLPVERRAAVLASLASSKDPAFQKAALRVSQQEPSETVVWTAFGHALLDDSWRPFLQAKNAGPIPSAVLIARARALLVRSPSEGKKAPGPNDEATLLLQKAIDQEREHPAATAAQLSWAVNMLVDRYTAAGQPGRAAEQLRLLIGRGESVADSDTSADDSTAIIGRLLELQGRFGPLPGLDRDLLSAGDDNASQAALTIAAITRRLDDATTSRMILAAALADIPGESDTDRAERLFTAGDTLFRIGLNDAAEGVLERVVAIDTPGLDKLTNAYLRLSDIHLSAGDQQLAGDCLQRALDHLTPGSQLTITRGNGRQEVWPREEIQGRIAWLYLVAARKKNDPAEIKKQALAVMESGTTDSEVFLDTLPTLEAKEPAITEPAAVDAFFDRVYAKASERFAAAPADPMEMNDLAWLDARSGRRLDEALKLGTDAVAARPDEAAYLDTLAEAKFRTGAAAEALALETRASSLLPDNTFMKEQVERFKKAASTQPSGK